MINLIQPITVQQAYDGITQHGGEHHEIGDGGRLMMTMATDSPSPEPQTDSRSAHPREIRAWRWLRIVKRDETFSLIFSLLDGIYGVGVEVGGASGGPRDRERAQGVGAPPPSWTGCGPPCLHLLRAFFIFSETCLRGFSGHSEKFCFLHIKQHHGSSAENSISPG